MVDYEDVIWIDAPYGDSSSANLFGGRNMTKKTKKVLEKAVAQQYAVILLNKYLAM